MSNTLVQICQPVMICCCTKKTLVTAFNNEKLHFPDSFCLNEVRLAQTESFFFFFFVVEWYICTQVKSRRYATTKLSLSLPPFSLHVSFTCWIMATLSDPLSIMHSVSGYQLRTMTVLSMNHGERWRSTVVWPILSRREAFDMSHRQNYLTST